MKWDNGNSSTIHMKIDKVSVPGCQFRHQSARKIVNFINSSIKEYAEFLGIRDISESEVDEIIFVVNLIIEKENFGLK